MNTYDTLKQELLNSGDAILALFEKAQGFAGIPGTFFHSWVNTLNVIRTQIEEDMVRVAVVGPIKSGKSTFVNALFKDDYLKRGAGVITSIVTRIRCGDALKAAICFKAWDEVNRDIEQGLSLFPSWKPESEDFRFDLRKSAHREMLEKTLESLSSDQLITKDTRNTTTVLLSSYLSGYDRVKDIAGPDEVLITYENDAFHEHRNFTGNEILAVYIKDIQLTIQSDVLDGSIEIADCQGSDSPNPLHLAMIQDYLSLTHFIVYVISSRTGLRQADIRFLTMIRDMGIMDNMLFAVNCDFSEHESFEEFSRLMAKIREELSLIITKPEVFTLSALYNLFRARKDAHGPDSLPPKDRVRLEQWEAEKTYTELSDKETRRFATVLHDKLTRERYALLLGNHVERLGLITHGLAQWAGMNKDLLSRDSDNAADVLKNITKNQNKTTKVSDMIRSTLDGAMKKVNDSVKGDVENFFDERNGEAIAAISSFIKNYEPSFDSYFDGADIPSLNRNLFLVYQDFKNALDTLVTESVTPKIAGFVRKEDERILSDLDQMTRPYANMVDDALKEYGAALSEFGIVLDMPEKNPGAATPDLESLKSLVNLKHQPASQVMHYSARVKAETYVIFGFYNMLSLFKKIFKKKEIDKKADQIQALKDGLARMKKETLSNVLSHFRSYKENIKFQYFFKLTDAVAQAFYDYHTAHFKAYVTDLETLAHVIKEKKLDKETVITELSVMETQVTNLKSSIQQIKEKIALL